MAPILSNCTGHIGTLFHDIYASVIHIIHFTQEFPCRLPVPRPGQVLGLVGTNGIGKSTALKVLAGKLKPNLGRFNVIILLTTLLNLFLQFCVSSPIWFSHCRILRIGKKY